MDKPHLPFPIHIDHTMYKAPRERMTALELRHLPEPPIGPDRDFFEVVPGQGDDLKLPDDAWVDLKPGMHFYSAPKTINPGNTPRLPEADGSFLHLKGYHWELRPAAPGAYLVLLGVRLAPGKYDRETADVMVRIPPSYPMAALDMFYVAPELRLKSGEYPNAANTFEDHGGRRWQRFSRHLPGPWRPGVDSLAGFMALALGELQGWQ